MKKYIAVVAGISILMTGCGNLMPTDTGITPVYSASDHTDAATKPTDPASVESATDASTKPTTSAPTEPPTTIPPTTEATKTIASDSSAKVMQDADGSFFVNFKNGCSMFFPASWAGRVSISESSVYSDVCLDPVYGGGLLFTVECRSEKPQLNGNERYLLGSSQQGYLFATIPQDVSYDLSNSTMHAEYTALSGDLDAIFRSAVCTTSPADFTPIPLSNYVNPEYDPHDGFFMGHWEAITVDWEEESILEIGAVQSSPYLIFCSDGTLAYQCFSTIYEGSYIINTDDNDYNYAIGFMNGKIMMIGIYHMVMSVTEMPEIKATNIQGNAPETTTTWGFDYWSDSQVYGLDPWME